jgi:hypothetical protein
MPRPARSATGAQPFFILLGIDRDEVIVDAAQIRQVCRNGPNGLPLAATGWDFVRLQRRGLYGRMAVIRVAVYHHGAPGGEAAPRAGLAVTRANE